MFPEEVFLLFGVLNCLTLLSCSVIESDRRDTRVCHRIPSNTTSDRTPGDNGFRIQIAGLPLNGYTPGHVYTVSLHGTYPNQYLTGFMLVAVPVNAVDELTSLGNFQLINRGETRFASDHCPDIVTHIDNRPKSGVEFIWTAPPTGAGCVEFRATVIERPRTWFADEGALRRIFCEQKAVLSTTISSTRNYNMTNNAGNRAKTEHVPSLRVCHVTGWSEWSECSTSCGRSGVQVRRRTLTLLPPLEDFQYCRRQLVMKQTCSRQLNC